MTDLGYVSMSESDALHDQIVEAKKLIAGLLKSVRCGNGKNKPRAKTDN